MSRMRTDAVRRAALVLILLALAALCPSALGEATEAPAAEAPVTETPATEAPAEDESPQPAKGYVLVTTATQSGWLPLPESEEYSYTLRQLLPDGTEAVNVIHLTPEGVYMEDSTCANHDCVDEGIVTLENRSERILGNMIVCLPNQVILQLYTPEEILELVQGDQ